MSRRYPIPSPKAGTRVIVETVAIEAQLPMHVVQRVVSLYLAVLRDHVWQDGKVRVPDLGVFRVRMHRAKRVRPPGQAEIIELQPKEVVSFRASKNWRTR